jgi:hypothetical protein
MNSVLKHVYAFAPPRVGNGAFASIFDRRLNGRVSCFVYKSDIVPSLPPQLAQSLNFAHVGQFYGVDAAITTSQPNAPDAWLEQEPPERARSAGQLLLALTAAFSSKLDFVQAVLSVLRRPSAENVFSAIYCGLFEERRYSFYDHLPQHYVTASQLPNRRHLTELGDDF